MNRPSPLGPLSPSGLPSPPRTNPRVRHLSDRDWDEIVDLEFRTYDPTGLSEGRAALQARFRASPPTCFVLRLDGLFAGYVLALPYPESAWPELAGTEATAFAAGSVSGNLHLHDLVIDHALRGRGLGRHLLRHLTATAAAHGFERISLVAVGGSDRFWARNGFAARPEVLPAPGYGADAVYMSAPVAAVAPAHPGSRPVAGRTAPTRRQAPGARFPLEAVIAAVPRTDVAPLRGSSPHPQKG